MNTLAIELDNISYAYRSDWLLKRIPSIQNVQLTIPAGETFGFLGHNGAGKTTTIKCLLNLVTPQQGSIRIFGEDARSIESRRLVGYVPEQPYFYDHLTVYEILDMYAALTGIPSAERDAAIQSALEAVHMTGRSKSRMRALSKGLTQRIAMAQAIIARPKLLVLDEPFSGLDPLGRKEFVDLLRSLKEQGTTIFMSSHILSDVEQLCDRISIMKNGTLRGVFTRADIQAQTHGTYELVVYNPDATLLDTIPHSNETVSAEGIIRLHYPDRDVAYQALEQALSLRAEIGSFTFVHGGLEELFVKLIQTDEGSLRT
jgi:ABC-2 type transport system ATP-binding protein